jgi:glycosyltransferase involved in cell wall biosynthesis
VLAIVPPGWYGVTTSTRNNFPNLVLCPEDLYEPERAVEEILAKGFETVVFSGLTDVSERVARGIRERSPGTRRLIHYHGSFSQSAQPEIRRQLRCVLNLAREGGVEKVGCAKAGMAPVLQAMGVDASYLPYRIHRPGQVAHRAARSPRRVGVFVRNILVKNVHTQFVAACMVSNAEIHANKPPDLSYLARRPRIAAHGEMPYDAFLKVLGEMDLNLYVSLSECYPMVVVESLIRGVPCLTSHSHEVFEHDRELGRTLIVSAHDNPAVIAEQAERVLAEREAIGRRCATYAVELNTRAEALLNEFVGCKLYGVSTEAGEGRNY